MNEMKLEDVKDHTRVNKHRMRHMEIQNKSRDKGIVWTR